MKILLIGATGTIGKAVAERLRKDHEVLSAGFSSGDVKVDLGSPDSIRGMFEQVGRVDAIVSTAGQAKFGPLQELTDGDFQLALNNKLMGQVNLVRLGHESVNPGGSITLTSGILSREPMEGSVTISMANGALESFAKAAALELKSPRVNIVAPVFVKETMVMMGMDSTDGVSAEDTGKAYLAAVTGTMHGETLDVPDYV